MTVGIDELRRKARYAGFLYLLLGLTAPIGLIYGASTAMAIAAAIIALQIPLSAWWLSRFRFGPVEWIWRRLTYGRPL
jgi:uncharacterized membrane protein YeiB